MAASETANRKTFSIVIATYNCGQKVENTLRSILSQNKELFELIVVDGASTDDTLDFLRKYEADLTLISEKDKGVYDAFNKGIDLAEGKYIYFIGAGDCLRPNVLEQVRELLPPEENPAFVYGSCYLVKRNVVWSGREFDISDLICENICHQAVFYHRSLFAVVGKYELRYKVFADWFFNFRCFARREISKQYISCVIADYEEGGLSAELGSDSAFKRDFPSLVKRHLGVSSYLKCKAFMTSPNVYSFAYGASSALFGHLFSFGRLSVRAYRRLKKSVVNRV